MANEDEKRLAAGVLRLVTTDDPFEMIRAAVENPLAFAAVVESVTESVKRTASLLLGDADGA